MNLSGKLQIVQPMQIPPMPIRVRRGIIEGHDSRLDDRGARADPANKESNLWHRLSKLDL